MLVGYLTLIPVHHLSLQAYRVLEQPDRHKDMTKDDFMERHRAWCCSTVPEQALCGISRIWVFSLARRQGMATRMLDTVRQDVTVFLIFQSHEAAFVQPTNIQCSLIFYQHVTANTVPLITFISGSLGAPSCMGVILPRMKSRSLTQHLTANCLQPSTATHQRSLFTTSLQEAWIKVTVWPVKSVM